MDVFWDTVYFTRSRVVLGGTTDCARGKYREKIPQYSVVPWHYFRIWTDRPYDIAGKFRGMGTVPWRSRWGCRCLYSPKCCYYKL